MNNDISYNLFGIKRNSPDDLLITLAGNPNVGKSTIFNRLTGLKQHTGNWSGKTVENTNGYFKYKNHGIIVADIPGCYSLTPHSPEEEAARDFICFGNSDKTLVVCDASCLEKNLALLMQIFSITNDVILCVNLIDESKKHGITIDYIKLSEILGIPVIPAAARSGEGIDRLMNAICCTDCKSEFKVNYPYEIQQAVDMLIPELTQYSTEKLSAQWIALKLLENDISFITSYNMYLGINLKSDKNLNIKLQKAYDYLNSCNIAQNQISDLIAAAYVRNAETIYKKTVKKSSDNKYTSNSKKLDRFLTGKFTGFISMFAMLMIILWITITGANYPSSLLQEFFFSIEEPFYNVLYSFSFPEWLCSITVYGVYRVLAWIVSVMLPPMAIFFPMFALLEDFGYLPRIAFNMDKCFKSCNSCGKQCLSMAMGFGCNATGVTGCRIIDSPRERLIAILTNSFIPCNGRFPMIMALIVMYFSDTSEKSILSALLLTLTIMLGIVVTFINSKLLSLTILKGTPSSFTLELPPYRKPEFLKVILRTLKEKVLAILGRAVITAIPAGIIIWIAANVRISENITLLTAITNFFDPFGKFLGLDGTILTAFLFGIPANEIVIPIMIMAYTSNGTLVDITNMEALKEIFTANGWNITTAICTIVFSLFHFPCMTTLLTIKKETKSFKWTIVSFILPLLNGIILCSLINIISKI